MVLDFPCMLIHKGAMQKQTKDVGGLARRYVVSPFSVLDGRSGPWQDRKRQWLACGIEGEVQATGRGAGLAFNTTGILKDAGAEGTWVGGTSVFDPVLTECLIEWFCPQAGQILDPFAGGPVRGYVASRLHRHYTGIELRQEQVDANKHCWSTIGKETPTPTWLQGDSKAALPSLDLQADMILTCPPYGDLEVYSDDPADISHQAKQDHDRFIESYRAIIAAAASKLKTDSFAAIVIGDYRDKRGIYRNFSGITCDAAADAGLSLYNEAILINPAGTLPLRVGGQMVASRKLGRCHQTVLIFVKGDPRAATARCALNAPAEMGCKDLPAVSKPKRRNTGGDVSVAVASQLPSEAGVDDGSVGVEDGGAVDA